MKGLKIENVSFKFGTSQPDFFKNVSLAFEPGSIHFIQGKNGSGKSTLFRILQGNIAESEILTGSFSLDTTQHTINRNKVSASFTKQVKTVVQQVREMIADQFTVGQNLQLAQLNAYPGLQKLTKQDTLPNILRSNGVNLETPAHQLSGGQKQILAIMMALQRPTRILLLDEPTAALDPRNAHMVMQSLQELAHKRDLIILVITHERELVHTFAKKDYVSIASQNGGVRKVEKQFLKLSTQ